MTKKRFALFLSALAAAALAACGTAPAETTPAESVPAASAPADSTPASSGPDSSIPAESRPADSAPADSVPADSQPAGPAGDDELLALLDEIYAAQPLEVALETLPLESLEDNAAAWMVGLAAGDVLNDVEAGVVSAPLINAQAYTLTLLRLKEGVDLAEAGQALLDDANAQKWVCVFPDMAAVAGRDGILCFVLADSEVADAEALANAFADAMGGAQFSGVRPFSEADLGGVWDPMPGDGAVAAVPQ